MLPDMHWMNSRLDDFTTYLNLIRAETSYSKHPRRRDFMSLLETHNDILIPDSSSRHHWSHLYSYWAVFPSPLIFLTHKARKSSNSTSYITVAVRSQQPIRTSVLGQGWTIARSAAGPMANTAGVLSTQR